LAWKAFPILGYRRAVFQSQRRSRERIEVRCSCRDSSCGCSRYDGRLVATGVVPCCCRCRSCCCRCIRRCPSRASDRPPPPSPARLLLLFIVVGRRRLLLPLARVRGYNGVADDQRRRRQYRRRLPGQRGRRRRRPRSCYCDSGKGGVYSPLHDPGTAHGRAGSPCSALSRLPPRRRPSEVTVSPQCRVLQGFLVRSVRDPCIAGLEDTVSIFEHDDVAADAYAKTSRGYPRSHPVHIPFRSVPFVDHSSL
jgi:hypothetical protein